MFKKILSSIGIGSAKVDFVLPKDTFYAGETIEGKLRVEGGISEQVIDEVYTKLVVQSKFKHDDEIKNIDQVLHQNVLAKGFTVQPGEQKKEIPATYTLPENIPITCNPTKLLLVTCLDISAAINPKDNDYIQVLPGKRLETVMRALENVLGFRRKKGTGSYNGHYQEFEYLPGSFMRDQLDELEVVYTVHSEGIGLNMQIDKKARGLFGGLMDKYDLDERNTACLIRNDQITSPNEVASLLAEFIKREYQKI